MVPLRTRKHCSLPLPVRGTNIAAVNFTCDIRLRSGSQLQRSLLGGCTMTMMIMTNKTKTLTGICPESSSSLIPKNSAYTSSTSSFPVFNMDACSNNKNHEQQQQQQRVISGFRREALRAITQQVVVTSYRCFGTTYRSNRTDMRRIGCPETSVRNYHHNAA